MVVGGPAAWGHRAHLGGVPGREMTVGKWQANRTDAPERLFEAPAAATCCVFQFEPGFVRKNHARWSFGSIHKGMDPIIELKYPIQLD